MGRDLGRELRIFSYCFFSFRLCKLALFGKNPKSEPPHDGPSRKCAELPLAEESEIPEIDDYGWLSRDWDGDLASDKLPEQRA